MNDEKPKLTKLPLTRQELYDKVWSTPIVKLSRLLGLSDRGLSKLCMRYSIPTPGLGYWRRIETGETPPRTPLPETEYERPIEFIISNEPPSSAREIAPIPVPEALCDPHAVITSALKARKMKGPRPEGTLHIRVTDSSLTRASLVLDTIIKALEARGAKILIEKQPEVTALIGAEKIPFHIEERQRLELIEGTKEEKAKSWYSPQRDFHPTGRLALVIDTYADFMRRTFQDGAKQRVEHVVGEFVDTIFRFAEHHRQRTEERRREDAEFHRREELRRQEKARIEYLESRLELLHKAHLIADYLDHIAAPAGDPWITWVSGYVNRLKLAAYSSPKLSS